MSGNIDPNFQRAIVGRTQITIPTCVQGSFWSITFSRHYLTLKLLYSLDYLSGSHRQLDLLLWGQKMRVTVATMFASYPKNIPLFIPILRDFRTFSGISFIYNKRQCFVSLHPILFYFSHSLWRKLFIPMTSILYGYHIFTQHRFFF